MTKRQDETGEEYYARRAEYFRKYYQQNREARLKYQEGYEQRPGVRELRLQYFRNRHQAMKKQEVTA
ncbi:TPA_asm: hypothetical protein vir524_00059 [Caudoviricetes sp. vir524]|jgi:hypothetical protein|nr:TPA_asm: hypothetical protein vir524_00059 [Caudoviricetes sp. vir524]